MVEATNPHKNLDVKLSLDLASSGKSPVVKRVLATDYKTLMAQAQTLAGNHGVSGSECSLRYYDGDNWVIVEDNDDLQLAYAIALSDSKKVTFSVKPINAPGMSSLTAVVNDDEEMKHEQPATGHKKNKKDKVKGIPRKALKNLINNQLEKQSKEVFHKLLQSNDLPTVEQASENAEVVHENISCDGCSTGPIRGLRYKCSVCKNFDFCAICEERLGHEHAFLKIRVPGGAPDVMITMLDEENPTAEQEEAKSPMQFINQIMQAFGTGGQNRGGRGGRGGRGRGGCHGAGGPPFRNMMKEFMGKMGDCQNWNSEDWQKKMQECGQKWNFHGKQSWKEARAIIKSQPKEVLEVAPGQTKIVEITVYNDTHWPWKAGCTLTLSDEQADDELPIDVFSLPIEQEVKGKSAATFSMPLSMAHHMLADEDRIYELSFTFRGPKGQPFGAPIILKMKCVLPKPVVTDIDVYKLAIKLHEQLQLGSLDDCIKAVRENNCDEADSIKALQRKN